MLGVASEQLVLLLIEAFTAALVDGGKKSKFEKELDRGWQINIRYRALKERLDLMVDAKSFHPSMRRRSEANLAASSSCSAGTETQAATRTFLVA